MADRHDFSHHDISRQVFWRAVDIHRGTEYRRNQIIAWHHKYWRVNTGVPVEILPAVRAAVDEANKMPETALASTVKQLIVQKL